MKRPERIIYLSAHHLRYWMDHENVVKAEIAREPDATHSVPYAPYSEPRETAVRELVELVRALIMESPGALSTRRFMALRDAVAAIEEAD